MKRDDDMKPDNKKGFPIILIISIVGLILFLVFQNISPIKLADVAFSHQLEHLVNLDLINPNNSKKISANDNLVTFNGSFRDDVTETGKDKYRYLTLLNQRNDLSLQEDKLIKQLDKLGQQVVDSSAYFLRISSIKIPDSGFVVIPKSFNLQDRSNDIVIEKLNVDNSVITFFIVKELLAQSKEHKNSELIANLSNSLTILIQEFRSQKLGIWDEGLKKKLRETEFTISGELYNKSSLYEKISLLEQASDSLENIIAELLSDNNGVKLYKLRSVRNYLENLELYNTSTDEYTKNLAQLDKARAKVSNAIWFFNNQELSNKSLEEKNQEEFHQWFIQTSKEWENFSKNKSLSFKAPDQPRNNVLEKTFKSEEPAPNYFSYIFTFFPILLIGALLYFFFSKQMKGVGSSAMNFGKSPAKLLNKFSHKRITFDDVAGIDEAKEELEEVVDFLRDPTRYTKLGAKIPKGILLIGAPGTGKTLIAKAVAGEAQVPFFSISGSDFVEMFVGVGASRVRDMFEQAKKNAPSIIFIDEIDAVGRHRGSGLGGGHDEREQTLNQLLVEIDGMESQEGIIIIAATNRPDVLDSALLRPGRFDRSVMVDLPDSRGRLAILKVHIQNVKITDEVDLKEIANRTPGASGADLQNIINEAALFAAKKRRNAVTQADLRYAQDKVRFGKERKSLVMNEEDKRTTAWHEAGHALIGLFLNTPDKVSKVTCIPRGRSLGATHFEMKNNRVNYKKKELIDQMAVSMGGRVAEEITNNDPSSGAKMDIMQATSIARSMVCEWGMSEKIGMISFAEDGNGNLMNGFHEKEYSDETAMKIDIEVKKFLDEAYERAKKILNEKYDLLTIMANSILEFETLEREDLDKIMNGTWDQAEKRSKLEDLNSKSQKTPPPIPFDIKKEFTGKQGGDPEFQSC